MENELKEMCLNFLDENNFNSFKVAEWKDLTEKNSIDLIEYDRLVLYFATQLNNSGVYQSNNKISPNFLYEIQTAVYCKLKDESFKAKMNMFIQFGTIHVSELLADFIGQDSPIFITFCAFVFMEIYLVGIDAWCRYYKDRIEIKEDGK